MLQLVVPALLDPWPGPIATPRLPALERLIARADRKPAPTSCSETLFTLFHIPSEQRATAPFCWLGLTGERPEGWVMHADPVHFRADRDQLLLFSLPEGDLTEEEAALFVSTFNQHFADDGITLHAPHPQQWFIVLVEPPNATFTPLVQASGRSVESSMPQGAEAQRWRQLLNEVQMLFFPLPLNDRRSARGALPVNGLWFSGAGCLPDTVAGAPMLESSDEDCLVRGLSRSAAGEDAMIRLSLVRNVESALMMSDRAAWLLALQQLDERVDDLLRQGTELMLYPCNGYGWHWKPAMNRRFWRRSRALGKERG